MTRLTTPIFDHAQPKNFLISFWFLWICINMQKTSSSICSFSDKVNFRVSSPDWPHPFLTLHTPKIFNNFFNFYVYVPACKKSVNSICPFLQYNQFYNTETRLSAPILTKKILKLKNFWPTFNFCEFVSTCKKWGYFINLFCRNSWLKNPAIWLA